MKRQRAIAPPFLLLEGEINMVHFDSLMIEVTRKCNMHCDHCLRGDAQDNQFGCSMSEILCKQIYSIERLTLTGGEPSLAADDIIFLLYYLQSYRIKVGSFYIETNAFVYNPDFVTAVNELYQYCRKPKDCILTISIDQFHSSPSLEAVKKYRELPYYHPIKKYLRIPPCAVLNEGRAKENGIGWYEKMLPEFIYGFYYGVTTTIKDTVYINALGDVLLGCNISYADQSKHSIGNILNDDLEAILWRAAYHPKNLKRGYVHILSITSDPSEIMPTAMNERSYYLSYQNAVYDFIKKVNELVLSLRDPLQSDSPEDIKLVLTDIERNDLYFLMGKKISYSSDIEKDHGELTLTLTREALQDAGDRNV